MRIKLKHIIVFTYRELFVLLSKSIIVLHSNGVVSTINETKKYFFAYATYKPSLKCQDRNGGVTGKIVTLNIFFTSKSPFFICILHSPQNTHEMVGLDIYFSVQY